MSESQLWKPIVYQKLKVRF